MCNYLFWVPLEVPSHGSFSSWLRVVSRPMQCSSHVRHACSCRELVTTIPSGGQVEAARSHLSSRPPRHEPPQSIPQVGSRMREQEGWMGMAVAFSCPEKRVSGLCFLAT